MTVPLDIVSNLLDLRSEFSAFGECMYCGSTENLSREHIVPYGLGGLGAVPKSSCDKCATITGRFEREVLRGPLWGLRAYLRLSSRRRRSMPTRLPLKVVRKGQETEEQIPIHDHPIMLCFPRFSVPSNLTGNHVEGISIMGAAAYNFGRPIKDVLETLGADDFRVTESSKPVAFARMIAKIAWSAAVANGSRRRLDTGLRDAIMHVPNQIGHWVGTYTDPLKASPGIMHEIRLREDSDKGKLLAEVQLFANASTPRYGVILGDLP